MSVRTDRIAEQLRAEVSRILRDEVSDPRVGMLSIVRVKLSADLSSALLFWSPVDVSGEVDLEEMADGLESAAGYVRRQIAQQLRLRRTPALHFRYDDSIEKGSETLALIRSLEIEPADDPTPEQDRVPPPSADAVPMPCRCHRAEGSGYHPAAVPAGRGGE